MQIDVFMPCRSSKDVITSKPWKIVGSGAYGLRLWPLLSVNNLQFLYCMHPCIHFSFSPYQVNMQLLLTQNKTQKPYTVQKYNIDITYTNKQWKFSAFPC